MRSLPIAILAVAALLVAGCTAPATETPTAPTTAPTHAGTGSPQTTAPSAANPFPDPSKTQSVYGSGSSFVAPLMGFWALQYGQDHSKVQVTYSSTGSGQGRKDITNKDVLFAGTDAPMTAAEMAAAPGILTFPEALGPIGVVYNLDDVTGLKLDGETLGKILTGTIAKWDDDAIKALNPGVALPAATIKVVVRADSSGTTFAYTDFVARTSPTWVSVFGGAALSSPEWSKSRADWTKDAKNSGVGGTVQGTKNSIGYVDLSYVTSLKLSAALVKNQAGEFLGPTTAGATKAAASAGTLPAAEGDWSKVSIANAPGTGSYPISTYTYLLAYKQASSYGSKATSEQVTAFKQFAWWALHDGQQYADPLGFAPLPAGAVAVGEAALKSMA
ncbi:MAG: phosphate transport system substrate-binding protein [Thermoplasmata archaeon]|jgi:phosphate ABC transporter phosphate-binding protein|nr:phosphate transport system substrate-binding protein [Thermoplasmata archaeon]